MKKTNRNGGTPRRISIYVYPYMLEMVEEISKKRNKRKRLVWMEAIQLYIAFYKDGKL